MAYQIIKQIVWDDGSVMKRDEAPHTFDALVKIYEDRLKVLNERKGK